MNDREALLQALDGLKEQVSQLNMAQAVQSSAFVVLARHLAARGYAQLEAVAQDLETMGSAQPDEGWQSGHQALADALRLVHGLPSMQQK